MKRVNLFMLAAVIAVSSVFVSCTKEEKDPPTITVNLNGTDKIEIEVNANQDVTARIDFNAEAEIKQIDIDEVNGTNLSGYPKTSGFDSKTRHQATVTIPARVNTSVDAEVKLNVKVTDKDDKSANRQITIKFKKVIPAAGNIDKWLNKTLGSLAHTGSANSACASIDGTTYAVVGISTTNQAKVDFIYFNGSSNPFALAAPTNSSVGTLSSGSVSGWSTKNATKLAKLASITASQFDACENDELITTNVTSTAVSADIVTSLAAGNIVGFITASGKKGLIKVISTNTSSDANQSVTIDIKVQR